MNNFSVSNKGIVKIGLCRIDWQLKMGIGTENLLNAAPGEMSSFQIRELKNGVTELIWKGHPEFGKDLTVCCRWKKIGNMYSARIRYSNCKGALRVEEIHFPRIMRRYAPDDRVLLPQAQGYLTGPLGKIERDYIYAGNYNPFQFAACISARGSVYFAQYDPAHYRKTFSTEKKNGRDLLMEHLFYLPLDQKSKTHGGIPYESRICEYEGGWFQAAELYRRWAYRQSWYRNRIRKNPLADIDLWVWNRGRIADAIPPVMELNRRFSGKVALDWYWWHHNPYDTDFPEFWPPREGVEQFRKAVRELHSGNIYAQVYTNGMTWDMDNPLLWSKGGTESAVIDRNGEVVNERYNVFNRHRLAFVCGEAPAHRKIMEEQIRQIIDSGVDGVYLDMIGNMSDNKGCFNPAHKHAPGGGDYQVRGYRDFLSRLRKRYPGVPFSTEDCTERYLDLFDGSIVVSPSLERLGAFMYLKGCAVPAFGALYHQAAVQFGNYAVIDSIPPWDELWDESRRWPKDQERDWNRLYPMQFYIELGRTVVWGAQPMICNLKMEHFDKKELAGEMKFLLDSAEFHRCCKNWLGNGRMLDPEHLKCDEIEVAFLKRNVYTVPETSQVNTLRFPALLHSRWRDRRNKEALILCNYTDKDRSFQWRDMTGTVPAHSYQRIII